MIICKDGEVRMIGTGAELCMELSIITNEIMGMIATNTSKEWADKMIDEAYENSKLSKQEIFEKFDAGMKEAINDIRSIVESLNRIL